MQLALLSDVHSNLQALKAVLDDVHDQDPDEIAFLGDAVGYNAHPQECATLLDETCQTAVLGNHDHAVLHGGEEAFNEAARAGVEHSRDNLDDTGRAFLERMQEQTNLDTVHLVHASPIAPTSDYVFPTTSFEKLEEITQHPTVGEASIIAMGHTHKPFVRQVHDTILLNAGSVGQPRDRDPRACWALIDIQERTVQHRRVSYDIPSAAKAIHQAGLPASLAHRLHRGR